MSVKLPSFLRKHLARKIVALFFAVLIWIAVRHEIRSYGTRVFRQVPVEVKYDHNEVMLRTPSPSIDVSLSGPHRRLADVNRSDIKVKAKLPSVSRNQYNVTLKLSRQNVRTPSRLQIQKIRPDSFTLHVDRIVKRPDVPIEVQWAGKLPPGLKLTKTKVIPSVIDIRGPHRVIKEMDTVLTRRINLDNVKSGFETNTSLVNIPNVQLGTDNVHVSAEVVSTDLEKIWNDIPIRILQNPKGDSLQVRFSPAKATVHLVGTKQEIKEVTASRIHAFVNLADITAPGSYTRDIRVWVASARDVVAKTVKPASLNIVVTKRESNKNRNETGGGT